LLVFAFALALAFSMCKPGETQTQAACICICVVHVKQALDNQGFSVWEQGTTGHSVVFLEMSTWFYQSHQ